MGLYNMIKLFIRVLAGSGSSARHPNSLVDHFILLEGGVEVAVIDL